MTPPAVERRGRCGAWWVTLAERDGPSRLRMSASGRSVASVERGRGYVDVVRYEREADAILGAHVDGELRAPRAGSP